MRLLTIVNLLNAGIKKGRRERGRTPRVYRRSLASSPDVIHIVVCAQTNEIRKGQNSLKRVEMSSSLITATMLLIIIITLLPLFPPPTPIS